MTGHKSKVIGQEDSAEVSGDSEKLKIRNKRNGHKRGRKSGIISYMNSRHTTVNDYYSSPKPVN